MAKRRRGLTFRYRKRSGGSSTYYKSEREPKSTITNTMKTSKGTVKTTTTSGGGTTATGGRSSGYRSFTVSPPNVSLSSTPSVVVLLAGTLLIFATWDKFWYPFFKEWWTNNPSAKTGIPGNIIIGGIIAIALLGVIASMSEGAGGMVMLALVAAWVLFITMNGTGVFGNFLAYFSGTKNQQQTSTTTTPPAKTQAPAYYKPLHGPF